MNHLVFGDAKEIGIHLGQFVKMSEAGESNQAEINDQKDPSQNAVVVVHGISE
jgi:hypothetical protein